MFRRHLGPAAKAPFSCKSSNYRRGSSFLSFTFTHKRLPERPSTMFSVMRNLRLAFYEPYRAKYPSKFLLFNPTTKGAPAIECRTGTRLVSPRRGPKKKNWKPRQLSSKIDIDLLIHLP